MYKYVANPLESRLPFVWLVEPENMRRNQIGRDSVIWNQSWIMDVNHAKMKRERA